MPENLLTAVRKTRLSQDIVAQVRDLIRDGRLRAGQRLPAERDLAERFQVSRASVREAIRALEAEGLVVIRSGAGTFVSEEGFAAAMEALARRLSAEREALADLAEARFVLEPQIAALAAQRATDEDRAQLEGILRRQAQDVARGGTGARADTDFHSAVAAACHNQALTHLADILARLLVPARDEALQTPQRRAGSLRLHRAILDAIRDGDAEAARSAMLDHTVAVHRGLSRGRETGDALAPAVTVGPQHQPEKEDDST